MVMLLNTPEDQSPRCLLKGFYAQPQQNLVAQSFMLDTRDYLSYTVFIN